MSRIGWALAWALFAGTAAAEVHLEGGRVSDRWWGGAEVSLDLSGATPWRLSLASEPPRLVLSFEDAVAAGEVAVEGDNAGPVAVVAEDGALRVEVGLSGPMAVEEAGLVVAPVGARLVVTLASTDAESFAALSAAGAVPETEFSGPGDDDRFVVALDPGHGGVDPGAERGGAREADLMLALGLELQAALEAAGVEAVLTRDGDRFVALSERITRARAEGADVLLSLHADALAADAAAGASVYVLAAGAGDAASRRMAERHGGGDLIAGLDLAGQGADVATALMEVARAETGPASVRLAEALVSAMREGGVAVNGRPLREGEFAVLAAADLPSVLLETGFLSDEADRARLTSPAGRASLAAAVASALVGWAEAEELR